MTTLGRSRVEIEPFTLAALDGAGGIARRATPATPAERAAA